MKSGHKIPHCGPLWCSDVLNCGENRPRSRRMSPQSTPHMPIARYRRRNQGARGVATRQGKGPDPCWRRRCSGRLSGQGPCTTVQREDSRRSL
ncbi:hypothetical protein AH4AK4_1588 [Aeromonas hydrophila 4AK4]|nr:hypothetical protein AH4AK4_1588 [Aeromonas hydrophila 4AK4]